MSCDICDFKLNNSSKKKVICPYCDFACCKQCFQMYLTSINENGKCMGCSRELSTSFIASVTTNTFHNGEYREHQANVTMSKEMSLLPATQHLVLQEKKRRATSKKIAEIESQIKHITIQKRVLMNRRDDLQSELLQLSMINKTGVEKKQFLRGCPVADCRGFLSTSWVCGTCEAVVCPDCHEVKNGKDDPDHECDEEAKATAALLAKDTKPCPNCATPIYKISGCFGKDIPIRLARGMGFKMSQDIEVGDILVGDDGRSERVVVELHRGVSELFQIWQSEADDYVVNEMHILCFKVYLYRMKDEQKACLEKHIVENIDTGNRFHPQVVHIKVRDFINLPTSVQNQMKGYRVNGRMSNIGIHSVGEREYFGWEVQGKNKRFLDYDGTVMHNCDQMYCQHEDTPILMWDGTKKLARDVVVGDVLISGEGLPCRVQKLTSGEAEMYEIEQKYGDNYKVIGKHLLTLEKNGEIVDISVEDYLRLPCSEDYFRVAPKSIQWGGECEPNHPIDPYNFGVMLVREKHPIPLSYLRSSEGVRLELLAGMIDVGADKQGGVFVFLQLGHDGAKLCSDVRDLAHSLGLATTCLVEGQKTTVEILGRTCIIPVKLRANKVTDELQYPVSTIGVKPVGLGRYAGWEVSGKSHRYLLGDGTVTHNCTHCHSAFSWTRGTIERGLVHNPHYYQYLRETEGQVPRNPGDRPGMCCGDGPPDYMTIQWAVRNRNDIFLNLNEAHRLIRHIQGVTMHMYPQTVGLEDNSGLRVKYLMKEISEGEMKKEIKTKTKKTQKNHEVYQILDMFVNSLGDLFRAYVQGRLDVSEISLQGQVHALREYVNNEFRKISNQYKNVTPYIERNWAIKHGG